jgi:ParB-like chromosome segregation protein Spo0J
MATQGRRAKMEINNYAKSKKPHELDYLHEIVDYAKFEEIKNDMQINGWTKNPLVSYENELLNGSHRYAAAKNLEILIPVIDLSDEDACDALFGEGTHAEITQIILSETYWVASVSHVLRRNNPNLADELGIDAD